ncbi:MAG: hypothetical protein MGU50_24255 [Trichodesmium sp. MAG_R02]|nr:hypothetical protein [Trichodesmium sp. MAG_R02]
MTSPVQLSVISADLEAIIILNNNETIFGTIITNNFIKLSVLILKL